MLTSICRTGQICTDRTDMVLVYDSSGRAQGAGLDIELIELVEMSGQVAVL